MLTIYCHSFSFIIARNFEIVTYLNHTWILFLMIILAKQIYKCKLLITSLYNSNPGESERAQINSNHKVDKIKSKPKLGRAVWWVRWVPWVGTLRLWKIQNPTSHVIHKFTGNMKNTFVNAWDSHHKRFSAQSPTLIFSTNRKQFISYTRKHKHYPSLQILMWFLFFLKKILLFSYLHCGVLIDKIFLGNISLCNAINHCPYNTTESKTSSDTIVSHTKL